MKSKLSMFVVMLLFLMPFTLAEQTRVTGDIAFDWENAPDYPQSLIGTVSGDLVGSMMLDNAVTFDATASSVGVALGTLFADVNGLFCQGDFSGSVVNTDKIAGAAHLGCNESTMFVGT